MPREKTQSEKGMELIDSTLEETEKFHAPRRTVTVYKNKLNRKVLKYNLVMSAVFFGLGFLLGGGSMVFGVIVLFILGTTTLVWREAKEEVEY